MSKEKQKKRKPMGKRLEAVLLAALMAAGLGTSALPSTVQAETTAQTVSSPAMVGGVASFLTEKMTEFALELLDHAISHAMDYSAEAAANGGGVVGQSMATLLYVAQFFMGEKAASFMAKASETAEEISEQLTQMQSEISQEFATVDAQVAQISTEEQQNAFVVRYNELTSYKTTYKELSQVYANLVSAVQAYSKNQSEENKEALDTAYQNVEALYQAASANSSFNSIDFNFKDDRKTICELLSSYNYNYDVDRSHDPGDSTYWGADQGRITVISSYYDYLMTTDAWESEAYDDMKAVINACAGTAAYYLEAYQLYVTYEAQHIYSTPAEDLGISQIKSEADKTSYVEQLWSDYADAYYQIQRAVCQMISTHESEMDGWMRSYDVDSNIYFTPYDASYTYTQQQPNKLIRYYNTSTATVAKPGNENTHVNVFKPLGSSTTYALRVPNSYTPALQVEDTFYDADTDHVFYNRTARSADYRNMMNAHSQGSSDKNSYTTGYSLIYSPGDLSGITGTADYDNYGGNFLSYLKAHGINTDANGSVPFDNGRDSKSGYFLLTGDVLNDLDKDNVADEDFGWINISRVLDKANLSGSYVEVDSDDDLSSKDAVRSQNLTVMYKASSPRAKFSVSGDAHVSTRLTTSDTSQTELTSGSVFTSGDPVMVHFKPEDGYYISSLQLVGNRDNNESTNELLYDYLTGWSRGDSTSHVDATADETLRFFEGLEVDSDGYYSLTLPVSYGESTLVIQTSPIPEEQKTYTASIQTSTDGSAAMGMTQFASMSGATVQTYHAGDTVDIVASPYTGSMLSGLTVTETNADGTTTAVEVTDVTEDAGDLQTAANEKFYRFTMPAGDVTISADYITGKTVTFADNGQKTSTNDLLFFAELGLTDTSENQDNGASVMTYLPGDTVTIGVSLENQHILSKLEVLNTKTNNPVQTVSRTVTVSDGTGTKEVEGFTFTMPDADVSIVAEDSSLSGHTVSLDAGEGGTMFFATDATGEQVSNLSVLNPKKGDTVYVKVVADGDYQLASGYPTATQTGDADLQLKKVSDDGDVYSFTMGSSDVTVHAKFSLDIQTDVTFQYDDGITAQLNSLDAQGNATQLTAETGVTVQAGAASLLQVVASSQYPDIPGSLTVTVTDQDGGTVYHGTFGNEVASAEFTVPYTACTVNVSYAQSSSAIYIPDYATLKQVIAEMNSDDSRTADYYLRATYYVTSDFSCDDGEVLSWKYPDRKFTGTFDGQGHTISNLRMNTPLIPDIDYGGTLRNLTLDSFTNTNSADPKMGGAFFSYNEDGAVVDGCVLAGDSVVYATGLGYENQGTIQNCGINASVTIRGTSELAGFVLINGHHIYNSYTAATLAMADGYAEDNLADLACFTDSRASNMGLNVFNCYCAVSTDSTLVSKNVNTHYVFQKNTTTVGWILFAYYKDDLSLGLAEQQMASFEGDSARIAVASGDLTQMAATLTENRTSSDAYMYHLDAGTLSEWASTADDSTINASYPVLNRTTDPAVSVKYGITTETVNPGAISVTDASGAEVTEAAADSPVTVTIQSGTLTSLKAYNSQTGEELPNLIGDTLADAGDAVTFTMPAYPVHLVATFQESQAANRYAISRSHYNPGTVEVKNAEGRDLYTAFANSTVYVTGVPGDGYEVDEVQVLDAEGTVLLSSSSGQVIPTGTADTYSFTMPAQAVTVHVIFKKFTPTLTTQVVGDGTLTVNGETALESQPFAKGTALQVSIQAAEDSVPVKLTLYAADGTTVVQPVIISFQDFYAKATEGVYTTTLVMPDQNVILKAEFQPLANYTYYPVLTKTSGAGSIGITVEAGGGIPSAVIVGKTVTAQVAASDPSAQYIQSVELLAADGSVIGEPLLSADKESGTGSATLTFAMPDQQVTVFAVFADKNEPDQVDGVYQISTYGDLVTMAQNIQNNPDVYAGADYELTNDIDCSKDGVNQAWTIPIGTGDHPFNGTFEGSDYSIEHLDIQPGSGFSEDTTGLFGVIGTEGVVSHLAVLNITWSAATKNAGGIAGINRGTINYCSSGINIGSTGDESGYIDMDVPFAMLQTTVKGTGYAGGIAAINEGKILNSRNNAIVTGAEVSGGIAGYNRGVIDNFYNLGHVFGTEIEGGVVGGNEGTIKNGYNGFAMETGASGEITGQIAGTAESLDITDVYYVSEGNIAGEADGAAIDNSRFPAVQYKSSADMCTQAFADLLNQNASDDTDESLGTWVYNAGKNYGYPRIEATVLVQKTWTGENGITVTGSVHPDAALEVRKLDDSSTGGDAENYQVLKDGAGDGDLLSAYDISMRFSNGRRASFEGGLVITIPATQAEKLQDLKVLHYYSGELRTEEIQKLEDGSVRITVDHLSPFAVVRTTSAEETEPTVTPAATATVTPTPTVSAGGKTGASQTASGVKTGDTTPIAAMAVGLAAAGLLVLLLAVRKKKKGMRKQ